MTGSPGSPPGYRFQAAGRGSNPAARAIPIRETCAPSVLKMLRAYAGFFTQAMSAALLTD
jgi:hypothetical protein